MMWSAGRVRMAACTYMLPFEWSGSTVGARFMGLDHGSDGDVSEINVTGGHGLPVCGTYSYEHARSLEVVCLASGNGSRCKRRHMEETATHTRWMDFCLVVRSLCGNTQMHHRGVVKCVRACGAVDPVSNMEY